MTTKISTDNFQQETLELLTGGVGVTVYDTIDELPLTNVEDGAQAFVIGNNRLYLWTGTGWFNIALLNTSPVITSGPQASYILAKNGDPTVITLVANDPEGFPITWSYEVTSGSLANTATVSQSNNVFTITPSTNEADVGTFGITFTASDGVNLATAASSFTLILSAADQYYNQSIVLTTSGVNDVNNNTFIDAGNSNFTVTRSGNTTQGTFSPFNPAGWSGYFDGTGDYLSLPNSAVYQFGSGDFTIEFWFWAGRLPASGVYPGIVTLRGSYSSQHSWSVYMMPITGTLNIDLSTSGGAPMGVVQILSNPTVGRWYHVSICRSDNSIYTSVDGIVSSPTSFSGTLFNSTAPLTIGRIDANVSGAEFMGHISNLRIIKGTGLYTTDFIPPTESLTAVSGTSLLTLQDNRFKDNSTNNFAITRNGDTKITPFSPFLPLDLHAANTHGGSAYFDGTGDFLTIPDSEQFRIGTNSFTIDGWLYKTIDTTNQTVISIGPNNTSGYGLFFYATAGTTILALGTGGSGATVLADTTAFPLNEWTHFALVRDGTTLTLYINGVSKASTTWTTSWNASGGQVTSIGQWVDAANFRYGPGYMADIRVVNGTALYTEDFTPPTAPATPVANTSLLLNFTNAGIYDETGKAVLETVGDARVSTSVVKYGDSSMYFDGTGDYMSLINDPSLLLGGNDFTFECWAYPLSGGTIAFINGNSNTYAALRLYAAATFIYLLMSTSGSSWDVASGVLDTNTTSNTWRHLAITRAGSSVRMFVDGVQVGSTYSVSGVLMSGTVNMFGAYTVSPFEYYNGYISDLRITKGVARYTANFTPPIRKLGFNNNE